MVWASITNTAQQKTKKSSESTEAASMYYAEMWNTQATSSSLLSKRVEYKF